MATKPTVQTLDASGADIVNSIVNESPVLRSVVPAAEQTDASVAAIGNMIAGNPTYRNEFVETLWNRIGRVVFTSRMYSNNLAVLKKGMLDFGETVEEVFTNLAEPYQFDPDNSYANELKQYKPDVRTAFHVMNYQKVYKTSTSVARLRQAFLSMAGIVSLVNDITSKLYSAAYYDEQQVTKYMIGKAALNGLLAPIEIPAVSKTNAEDITIAIKQASDDFEFMSREFNAAGVLNHCPKSDQFLILSNAFNSVQDVAVLAAAFNMDKAQFLGRQLRVDSFGRIDVKRLDALFLGESWYTTPSEEELAAMDAIPCVLIDEQWAQIYDNYEEFNQTYVGDGLYWTHRYHAWKTFSESPYMDAAVFTSTEPSVTSVTVSPDSVTAAAGTTVQFSAAVETEGFQRKGVVWSATGTGTGDIVVTQDGKVTVPTTYTSAQTITVTATSMVDGTKKDTATITVS